MEGARLVVKAEALVVISEDLVVKTASLVIKGNYIQLIILF
ncbi:hypothetical protein [Psychrobacillus sp. NPDC093180]